tara:strand:+ start:38116 stop:38340 length:225 start_codon:yes stop_codon:yes gene_type:complete
MSIEKLLHAPHLVHQTCSDEMSIAEPAIAVCHDANPIIVISQEGRDVLVNLETVNELCRAIKAVKRLAEEARND